MITNVCKTAAVSCKETVYTYNIFHMVKAFFPEAEIRQTVDEEQEPLVNLVLDGGSYFSVMPDLSVRTGVWGTAGRLLRPEDDAVEQNAFRREDGLRDQAQGSSDHGALCLPNGDKNERKKQVTRRIYDCLSAYTGEQLAWGTLTGVRPVKLAMSRLESGDGAEETAAFLKREYQVSEEKAWLAARIAERERALLGRLDYKNGFSLYIGIPFCPSICSYCSFSSSPIRLWKDRVEDYLEALFREIRAIGHMTSGKKPDTVYIGGGTPVTLEASQLDRLLSLVEDTFSEAISGKGLLEYTVEAGRPDGITQEKLEVLRRHGISRISINPQTMKQETLDLIGRRHTVEDVKEKFAMAREEGFDNINMDLIIGLPQEELEDVRATMEAVKALGPDSLTVHSLAIKRAARLNTMREVYKDLKIVNTQEMIDLTASYAREMGMNPYYLYRQKNMAGNFENVGYARPGKECIYNILIMEEQQTIIGCGAGTTTKRVIPGENRIERVENVKNVEQYIERIDEMIERKRRLFAV